MLIDRGRFELQFDVLFPYFPTHSFDSEKLFKIVNEKILLSQNAFSEILGQLIKLQPATFIIIVKDVNTHQIINISSRGR